MKIDRTCKYINHSHKIEININMSKLESEILLIFCEYGKENINKNNNPDLLSFINDLYNLLK